MNRLDTILTLQKIGRIQLNKKDLLTYNILTILISPFIYEGHRNKIQNGDYTLEFTSLGLNIRVEKNLGILIINCIQTVDGTDYLFHEWRDLKDSDIADLIDIVIDKSFQQKNEENKDLEYEIRIYPLPEEKGNGYIAEAPKILGCYALGHTQEEALANVREEIKHYLANSVNEGAPSSKPSMVSSEPKELLSTLRKGVTPQIYDAVNILLTASEVKDKIKELSLEFINYKA